jgi:hypothetical protein
MDGVGRKTKMPSMDECISAIRSELRGRVVPESVEILGERLGLITVGIRQRVPIAFRGARMFRIVRWDQKPSHVDQVGAPPAGSSRMNRLSGQAQRVLYLADSPDTAFAESRTVEGIFCMSEWRVQVDKLALANGGIAAEAMAGLKNIYEGEGSSPAPTLEDDKVLGLLREIFTLDIGDLPQLYRWSIACALANGFSHIGERTLVEETNGITRWEGRYPFAAIAYPSTRVDRMSLNFALNDIGTSHVQLEHVQWVRRTGDGGYTSLDYANSWDQSGQILWANRPARFVLKPGEQAKITKVGQTEWKYETSNGSIPWFE